MAPTSNLAAKANERTVVLSRTCAAPRETVWNAWTDPERMAQWWGPRGFTNPICGLDVRPGGAIRIVMRAPEGTEHPMRGVFLEIVEFERLVFTAIAEDDRGRAQLEALTTVTFAEDDGNTKLTLHARAVGLTAAAAPMLEGMQAGWTQTLERLESYLGS